jgi:hypothetical protein
MGTTEQVEDQEAYSTSLIVLYIVEIKVFEAD